MPLAQINVYFQKEAAACVRDAMVRFSLFRRGKARNRRKDYVAADGADSPALQRRRTTSESSRASSSFDPNEYTLNTNDLNAHKFNTHAFDDDVDLEHMREWFFRKSIDDSPSRTDSPPWFSPRRVHDLDRGPSDYGSTLGGGKDIEELAELGTRVLALAPSDQIEGWGQTTADEEEGETTVRPVVVRAIELSRKKLDAVNEKEEESEDDGIVDDITPVSRDRTWGRKTSALDAIFGTNKPKKPQSNEVSPDDAKIVRVLSVQGFDSQENKHRRSWMRMKKSPPPPVHKLEPQVEGKVVSKGRSGLTSVASLTTGTSDNYTATTASSGSSNESGYTGDYGSLHTGSEVFIDEEDDVNDDFSADAMQLGGCVGGGCNPVAPCRTVAGEISYFVNELMDQEIVIKENSILNAMIARNKACLAEWDEKPQKKGKNKKQRGSNTRRGNTSGRRAAYSEFS